jgi:hypothetical protein
MLGFLRLPVLLCSPPPSVIAYFHRFLMAIRRNAVFPLSTFAGVPVHWYRKLLSTACTVLVLKSGLTSTFAGTSMGKVANHPPRFRLTAILVCCGSRVSHPQIREHNGLYGL